MIFFKEKRIKKASSAIKQFTLDASRYILSKGWEFEGPPAIEQLNEVYVKHISNDQFLRQLDIGAYFIFTDSPLTTKFVKDQIILPILNESIPPTINGAILMTYFYTVLEKFETYELSKPYRPEAELLVIWKDIAPDVLGGRAYYSSLKSEYPSERFQIFTQPLDKIYRSLEDIFYNEELERIILESGLFD